jgi:hypothetical protein
MDKAQNNMTMKRNFYAALFALTMLGSACTDFEELNTDPDNPVNVPSNTLFSGASKFIMDNVYDPWFSGRQCLVYAQYWAQRNYTEEDRYQLRQSVNNNYYNYLYRGISNLDEVIRLNTDAATAAQMSLYGANCNQIAAARTLKAWLYLVMTDTWGAIPYSDVGKLKTNGVYTPGYDEQKSIYDNLLRELKEAADQFDEGQDGFLGGDLIYNGNTDRWKKFANSLRCRVAVHLSKVDPQWKTYIDEATADGVFESNADNAVFRYSASAPYECLFYRGYFVSARNDFTITRNFCDLLKGQRDTLNNKQHPWEGTEDPRLSIYTTPRNGVYIGIPYGIPSDKMTSTLRDIAPTWYNASNHPVFLNKDFAVPLMTYAELQFILCEKNDYDEDKYKEGVRASIEYWRKLEGKEKNQQEMEADEQSLLDYVTAVLPAFNTNPQEALAVQKYIDLYINGTEAWTEYRRTGYPVQLLQPEQFSTPTLKFTTLSNTKGNIIRRVPYPTNESTLNKASFDRAVSKLEDGTNNYYSPMYWDVRTAADPHPANK